MVDFSTFRSRSFLGANVVAFIVSFAMLAMFFFIALYMQNVLGYSPLEAGIRFLPSTLVIIVVGPIAGRLSDRIGPRPLMVSGLVMASTLALLAELHRGGHELQLPGRRFRADGNGHGPCDVADEHGGDERRRPAAKAGVASGVLSMFRMIGGTFGVAVTGALIIGIGRSQLTSSLPAASADQIDRLSGVLAGGGRGLPPETAAAVQQAFLDALSTSLRLGAVVALAGALVAWLLIGDRAERPAADALPQSLAEADALSPGPATAAPAAQAAEAREPARA